MKILITGANGFLGRSITEALSEAHELRLMDVTGFTHGQHEVLVGDVTDPDTVTHAVKGMDALVIAHMFSRTTDRTAYDDPALPFDINVKGTALLFQAAQQEGINRTVLISSLAVTGKRPERVLQSRDLPVDPSGDIYSLTKGCQEVVARYYHRAHGMAVASLRVGHIIDAATMTDKYGEDVSGVKHALNDRYDIGTAVKLVLALPDLGYEAFSLAGMNTGGHEKDIAYTRQRLGWEARYRSSGRI